MVCFTRELILKLQKNIFYINISQKFCIRHFALYNDRAQGYNTLFICRKIDAVYFFVGWDLNYEWKIKGNLLCEN